MAVTKILARRGGLAQAIAYVVNGDKTEEQVLTATQGCSIKSACAEMQDAKIRWNKTDGVQLYHIIQSFRPGEIEPELALEIAQEFVREHLPGYQAVIGIHTDREHIHAHIAFNSINQLTGEKYHSNARSYYQQIRAISDRLCREHGLSVIVQGAPARSVSYIEWLRQSKGQPTFRSMLEADLRDAIRDANDLGHFFLLMEHKGYEIHHGGRLGFRLRGQERFQYPGRRDPLFTEDGIRAAIQGNLEQIEAGLRPVLPARLAYQPYRKHPRYSGFLALYVHYLYLLGKIEKRQYPPRMTPHLRQAVMRFERYQAQFAFLRENDITTPADMAAFEQRTEETLGRLTRQRTLLNVRKKKRLPLYAALADAEALEPSRALYEEGLTGMEQEFEQYMKAVKLLEDSGIPQEVLKEEKAEVYPHDELDMDNAGSAAMISNWRDVLAVYAVRTTTDASSPDEVATLTEEKLDILRQIFWEMNEISYWLETISGGEDEEDTVILHIRVAVKDHLQMAEAYHFTTEQKKLLEELMQPEYEELFMRLTGSYQDIALSDKEVAEIMEKLPADLSEERKQVVLTAYQLLGKVNYFWGGKSLVLGWDSRWGTPMEVTAAGSSSSGTVRPFGLDCSGFVDWVFYNVTSGSYVIGHGGGASSQHSYCTDISWSDAQPGDLVFYPGDSHVGIVCGFDGNGNVLIIHCASGYNNVVVTGKSGFTSIARPIFYHE